jgi:hypothetical protein
LTYGCLIQPQFTITPGLLAHTEQIAALRERIMAAGARKSGCLLE